MLKYKLQCIVLTIIIVSSVGVSGQNIGPARRPISSTDVLSERAFLETGPDYIYDTDTYEPQQPQRPPPSSAIRSNLLSGGGGAADCRQKTRHLPHEKYCDLYYSATGCDDGQKLLRSCPNGLLYTGSGRHGLIGVCDYPHNVDCQGREKHNPPQSTEHCDWLYGIFGHETSCTRYWTCWNGTATEQFCVGGLLYNEETHACDWPQNVGGCQKHPLCKDDANGNVPLGKSCNRYWACQGGYPRLQRCPAMLVFDRQRKRCVSPPTEDCDVPPVTNAPEDQEGSLQGDGSEGPRPRQNGGTGDANRRRYFEQPQRPTNIGGQAFDVPDGSQLLPRPGN